MKRNLLISFFCLLCLWVSAAEKTDFDKAVRSAVERQMQGYPKSTLKDLYKNFFQDKFGSTGHIVSDTIAAGNYLRREMASYTETEGEIAEPTGWEGDFLPGKLIGDKERTDSLPDLFLVLLSVVWNRHPSGYRSRMAKRMEPD